MMSNVPSKPLHETESGVDQPTVFGFHIGMTFDETVTMAKRLGLDVREHHAYDRIDASGDLLGLERTRIEFRFSESPMHIGLLRNISIAVPDLAEPRSLSSLP